MVSHPSASGANTSDKRGNLPYHPSPVLHKLALVILMAVVFGTAVPAAGVSLPVVPQDVQVGGVEVGGLISVQAETRLAKRFAQPLRIFSGEKIWTVRPARLGGSVDIEAAVRQATKAKPGARIPLDVSVRERAVKRYVARLNRQWAQARARRDAYSGSIDNLAPSFKRARPGREVDQPLMVRRISARFDRAGATRNSSWPASRSPRR